MLDTFLMMMLEDETWPLMMLTERRNIRDDNFISIYRFYDGRLGRCAKGFVETLRFLMQDDEVQEERSTYRRSREYSSDTAKMYAS